MINTKTLCQLVIDISISIGDWIMSEQKKFNSSSIEMKSFNNLVSYVDKKSEERFIEELKKLIPNSGIIGEEGLEKYSKKEYTWIIDPLDGTTNFAHSIPVFCTSVALMFEGRIILGVVYDPNRKEVFHAIEGGGSFLNNTLIEVSNTSDLSNSLIATGFPYDDFSRLNSYLNTFSYFTKNTRGIRRLGSAALDLCFVACGRFDAFFEYALSPWDVAAGSLIVKEANGKVSDFNNQQNYIFGEQIIATNSKIHNDFQEVIASEFTK
jgi:myo-inositol-1(or 4)-monophosphatase